MAALDLRWCCGAMGYHNVSGMTEFLVLAHVAPNSRVNNFRFPE